MVPDMDLNSSFASRIVREELAETKEGGSLTQRLKSTKSKDIALLAGLPANNTALCSKFPSAVSKDVSRDDPEDQGTRVF